MSCDQCQVLMINGVRCHETGCPDAWKDTPKECFECGCDFIPAENRWELRCADCFMELCQAEGIV